MAAVLPNAAAATPQVNIGFNAVDMGSDLGAGFGARYQRVL